MKNALFIGLASALIYLPIKKLARAEINGNLGYIHSEQSEKSHLEANAFYKLPLDINAHTFIDFNKNGRGYFGKTSLDKKINSHINPRVQIAHVKDIYSQAGLGISANIPTPKNVTAKINFMPLLYSDKELVDKKNILGYFLRFNLPQKFSLKSFGEWNLNSKNGCEWDYGEIELSRKFNNTTIGYLPTLIKKQGSAIPKFEHRACIRLDF